MHIYCSSCRNPTSLAILRHTEVTAIQIFFTVRTTFDNRTVIIPNSKLSDEVIINLSREGKGRIDIELKFPFTIDFEAVKVRIDATS